MNLSKFGEKMYRTVKSETVLVPAQSVKSRKCFNASEKTIFSLSVFQREK